MILRTKRHASGRYLGLVDRPAGERLAADRAPGEQLNAARSTLEESFSPGTAPSFQEVMAEIGRILLCSLGLAVLLEIFARAAGLT